MIGPLFSNVIAIYLLLFLSDNLTDFVANESMKYRYFVLVFMREIRAKIVRITQKKQILLLLKFTLETLSTFDYVRCLVYKPSYQLIETDV